MTPDITPLEMKRFITRILVLEEMSPEDIGDDQLLFSGGLGLDSIDAFELGIALKNTYGLNLDGENNLGFAEHFRTPATLAAFVSRHRQPTLG